VEALWDGVVVGEGMYMGSAHGRRLSGCLWQLPREVFQRRVEDGVMPYGRVLCEELVYRSGHLDADVLLPTHYLPPSQIHTIVRSQNSLNHERIDRCPNPLRCSAGTLVLFPSSTRHMCLVSQKSAQRENAVPTCNMLDLE